MTHASRPGWSSSQSADDEGAHRDDRADREIDLPGDDDQRLAERDDADQRRRERDLLEVRRGRKRGSRSVTSAQMTGAARATRPSSRTRRQRPTKPRVAPARAAAVVSSRTGHAARDGPDASRPCDACAAASSIASRSNAPRVELGRDAAAAKDQDAIGHRHHLLGIVADQDDGDPLGRQMRDDAVDLRLGADVDAARRLVEDEDARRRDQPFGQQHLLLVAAGERAGQLLDAGRDDAHARRRSRAAISASARAVDQAEPAGEAAQHRQRLVGADRELQHEPLLVAVLGQERDAEPHRLARRAQVGPSVPSTRISPRSGRVMPNSISATSERPAPTSPKKPRISPARRSKLTSSTKPAPERPRTLEHRRADLGLLLGEEGAGLGADHVRGPSARA